MGEIGMITNSEGVAIGGFDPVAYFDTAEATPGLAEHSHSWGGATWYFASARNMAKFADDPLAYAPQFGGRCAFGCSIGQDAAASPEAFRVIDGRLYLLKDKAVRALSLLFTARMKRAAAEQPVG